MKIFKLRQGQQVAVEKINQLKNILCVFPTGYGKTYVGIEGVKVSHRESKLAFFVSPLRSLCVQLSRELTKSGYKVILDIGGTEKRAEIKEYNTADAIVTTYEKLDSILRTNKKNEIKKPIGYIIIDEIHNLGTGKITNKKISNRGQSVFSVIHKSKYFFPSSRFIGLSATIGNYEYVAEQIDAEPIYIPPEMRPIPLEKIYIDIPDCSNVIEENYRKISATENIINSLDKDLQYLILISSRSACEKICEIFRRKGFKADYHHSKLTNEVKEEKENKFNKGQIKLMFCTTTLSQGLNMSCDVVIIFHYKFYDKLLRKYILMERMLLDQVIGRAGRPNLTKNNKGLAYFLISNSEMNTMKEIMSEKIIIKKSYDPKSLICDWLVSGMYETLEDLILDLRVDAEISNEELLDSIKWLEKYFFIRNNLGFIESMKNARTSAYFFIHPEIVLSILSLKYNPNIVVFFEDFLECIVDLDEMVTYNQQEDSYIYEEVTSKYPFVKPITAKIMYFIFNNSFNIDNKDKDFIYTESFELYSMLGRYLSASDMIISDFEIKRQIDKLKLMINRHKILSEDEEQIVGIKSIGEVRMQKLLNNNINTKQKILYTSNETLSKILGMTIDKIIEMKKSL